jgi:hypothetical protein
LPDFLAARLPGLLASIEDCIVVASSARSVEAAADALRGADVTLPGAVRWLRRRIRAVRTGLAHVVPKTTVGTLAMEATPGGDLDKGRVLLGLRRSLSPRLLNSIPAPLGFRPTRGPLGSDQHGMGPDAEAAAHYGSVVAGSRAGWSIRSNKALPKSRPPPKICAGSGEPIVACKTAAPAFTFNGSSGSASIVRDMGSKNAPS